jgi:hypothetical protein
VNMKPIIFAVLLITASSIDSVSAQTVQCFSVGTLPVSSYESGGSITLNNYRVCSSGSSISGTGTMLYNNVSFNGTYWINGSLTVTLNSSGSRIESAVFAGGPLIYTFGSTYTVSVSFNDLTFNFNTNTGQQTTASGSLAINGVSYVADNAYFTYLFQ